MQWFEMEFPPENSNTNRKVVLPNTINQPVNGQLMEHCECWCHMSYLKDMSNVNEQYSVKIMCFFQKKMLGASYVTAQP